MSDPVKAADAGFLAAVVAWLLSHAVSWMPLLQAVALAVTVISGSLAAIVHGCRLFDRWRGRK